ncbi:LysR family transcriptional regulator [Fischerella sp. PCC 9605]|uniref:LysR family transcriptional regulator n=1 Tax=Fischerella sp. PCC 9605 TaxID=1173024 RepID=UPI00047E89DF|nr:LysR family transcriptional regulator [Fischerella sp. PCC 9605]
MAGTDRLDSLMIFVRVAKHLSFSEAARQLGMSPSAVSRSVQRLEERLSTRLLNRTTRSLSLTENGSLFYETCRQILSELEQAELALSQAKSIPTGTLRIDLVPSLARMHIIPALPRFAVQYPELNLEIFLNDRRTDLIDKSIDAVVRVGIHPDSNLVMQRIATARQVVCASPDYLKRYGTPKTPEDLRQHHLINHINPQTGRIREWTFQRNGKPLAFSLTGQFSIDHAEATTEAAIAGAGILQLYNFVVGVAIAQGLLVPVLEDYAQPGVPIAIVYPEKRYVSAKIRVFVEFMTELMRKLKRERIVE